MKAATERVTDFVRGLGVKQRSRISEIDEALGVYLRGNEPLFKALSDMLNARIEGRAKLPEPSDPLQCKSILARDREVQAILGRLNYVYRSPVSQPVEDDSEQPA
jgi:hypothetical protein